MEEEKQNDEMSQEERDIHFNNGLSVGLSLAESQLKKHWKYVASVMCLTTMLGMLAGALWLEFKARTVSGGAA